MDRRAPRRRARGPPAAAAAGQGRRRPGRAAPQSLRARVSGARGPRTGPGPGLPAPPGPARPLTCSPPLGDPSVPPAIAAARPGPLSPPPLAAAGGSVQCDSGRPPRPAPRPGFRLVGPEAAHFAGPPAPPTGDVRGRCSGTSPGRLTRECAPGALCSRPGGPARSSGSWQVPPLQFLHPAPASDPKGTVRFRSRLRCYPLPWSPPATRGSLSVPFFP